MKLMNFGARMMMKPSELLKLILSKNITRQELADLVGRNERTVRRWLSGTSPIPSWVGKILTK